MRMHERDSAWRSRTLAPRTFCVRKTSTSRVVLGPVQALVLARAQLARFGSRPADPYKPANRVGSVRPVGRRRHVGVLQLRLVQAAGAWRPTTSGLTQTPRRARCASLKVALSCVWNNLRAGDLPKI
jgi:hypothetical protein